MKNLSRVVDLLNRKFDWHFNEERGMSSWEVKLHDVTPTMNSLLWVRCKDPDGRDTLVVLGSDCKHLAFPSLPVPFPFKKRK